MLAGARTTTRAALLVGILLSGMGVAAAADLPVKAKPVAYYDWTGFYVGGYLGTAIGQSKGATPAFDDGVFEINNAKLTGGFQAGFNWQFDPHWLAGVEGDIGFLRSDKSFLEWNDPSVTVGIKMKGYSTVRGRFGYVTGPSLLYATGGLAFVRLEDTFGGLPGFFDPAVFSATKTGWTAGAGIETKLSQHWSVKTEYLYLHGGSTTFAAATGFGTADTTFDHDLHVIKSGLNYTFGGPNEGLPFFGGALLGPAHRWAGWYVGVNGGGVISVTEAPAGTIIPNDGQTDVNGVGFAGGAQAGYNYMLDSDVFCRRRG